MSLIINIDTATETASVSIAENGQLLQALQNESQKDHGAFVQTAIAALLKNTGTGFVSIDAIAVTAGPGSYTGLRVGMASAKGLCYALNKPLITISTLDLWASALISQSAHDSGILYCPMIDARRMEVFTAVYDSGLNNIMQPAALVLDENSFSALLHKQPIIFSGNGSAKWEKICKHSNASFVSLTGIAAALANRSHIAFLQHQFADLAYTEPFYLKEFQNNI